MVCGTGNQRQSISEVYSSLYVSGYYKIYSFETGQSVGILKYMPPMVFASLLWRFSEAGEHSKWRFLKTTECILRWKHLQIRMRLEDVTWRRHAFPSDEGADNMWLINTSKQKTEYSVSTHSNYHSWLNIFFYIHDLLKDSSKYNYTTLFYCKTISSLVTYLGEIGDARLVQGKGSASRVLAFSIRRILSSCQWRREFVCFGKVSFAGRDHYVEKVMWQRRGFGLQSMIILR